MFFYGFAPMMLGDSNRVFQEQYFLTLIDCDVKFQRYPREFCCNVALDPVISLTL